MLEENVFLELFKKDMSEELRQCVFSDYPSCTVLSKFGEIAYVFFVVAVASKLAQIVSSALEEHYARQKLDVKSLG